MLPAQNLSETTKSKREFCKSHFFNSTKPADPENTEDGKENQQEEMPFPKTFLNQFVSGAQTRASKRKNELNVEMIDTPAPAKEKKSGRFNGMSEKQVAKRTLPDHLAPNLDIIVIGINPGLVSAYEGHHYAGTGNHFWKCLHLSGLTDRQLSPREGYTLLQVGIGLTNMVARATKGIADLSRMEMKEGAVVLTKKLQELRPKIAVFNGKLIYEVFSDKKDFSYGKQPERVDGTDTYIWVMPSSSPRGSLLPRAEDKGPFYTGLKKFRDYLNGVVDSIDESDVVFSKIQKAKAKQTRKL